MGGSIGQGRASEGASRIEGVRVPAGYCVTTSAFQLSGSPNSTTRSQVFGDFVLI
jgi:hypothetical protein